MINAIKRSFRQGEFDCEDVVDHSSAYIDNDLKTEKGPLYRHISANARLARRS